MNSSYNLKINMKSPSPNKPQVYAYILTGQLTYSSYTGADPGVWNMGHTPPPPS